MTATTEWMRPSTLEVIPKTGTAWSSTANVLDGDRETFATAVMSDGGGDTGLARVRVTNLVAAMAAEGGLPANVMPVGIEVRVRAKAIGPVLQIVDSLVCLVRDGAIISEDKALGAAINIGFLDDVVYGSSADDWNLGAGPSGLQRALLEDTGFGVEFEAQHDLSDPGQLELADVQVRVTYAACFLLRNAANGAVLLQIADSARSISLAGLLTDGEWLLALSRVDVYGTESLKATMRVIVAAGTATKQLVLPTILSTRAKAAGNVELRFQSVNTGGAQLAPANWQIAEASDLGTVLATVTASSGVTTYTREVGPFANGRTVVLAVRATDGVGGVTSWVVGSPVAADSAGPAAPEVVE